MTNAQEARAVIANAQRTVVKAGSSSLTTPDGRIDHDRVGALVDVVAAAVSSGKQVVLVSSGAIACGLGPLGLNGRPKDLALAQAAASVGQGELIAAYASLFAKYGLRVGQVLLTADDIGRRVHYRNAQRTLDRLLDLGVVPIVNENDTVITDEIRVGDNDRLAALVSHLVNAQALVLLSDVDALYDGPPSQGHSKQVAVVQSPADIEGLKIGGVGSRVGSGGMKTKVEAAQMATDAGVTVVLTSAAHARDAINGAEVGTVFTPTGRRRSIRLLWLEHGSDVQGQLVLDPGAVAAVTERNASLLPAGIVRVSGSFDAGQTVELTTEQGEVVARGVVSFDAAELPALLGRSTKDLAAELGSEYEREVVHRDDLVILGANPRTLDG